MGILRVLRVRGTASTRSMGGTNGHHLYSFEHALGVLSVLGVLSIKYTGSIEY